MNRIRAIRDRLDLTQAALGEALGVTQGSVHFYEHGKTMPPDVAAKLIAYARSKGHALTFDDVYAEPETPKKAKRVAALKLSKAAA